MTPGEACAPEKGILDVSHSTWGTFRVADVDNMIELTAVFLKSPHGYVGFVEELPGVNSHGRTLAEARDMLGKMAAIAFDAERRHVEEFTADKDCLREPLEMPLPRR
jgi:predicted RNase H-like HicB family nuclease